MKKKLTTEQTDKILKALDEALVDGPWEQSNFLRLIGKNLRELRDDFASLANKADEDKNHLDPLTHRLAARAGQQKVYVSLYASDGGSLNSWDRIIANLTRQMVSRPIYEHEEDVKAMLRTKENKNNDAYVAIYINQSDILPTSEEKTPKDRLGKPLLTLKDKSLKLENIQHFVHNSGVYRYAQGRLIKIPAGESE